MNVTLKQKFIYEKAQNTLAEYKDSLNDEQILIYRDVLKPLTKEENKFYKEVVEKCLKTL